MEKEREREREKEREGEKEKEKVMRESKEASELSSCTLFKSKKNGCICLCVYCSLRQ